MWDERYGLEGYAYGTEPNDFLKKQIEDLDLEPLRGGRALCLAAGQGRNAVYLAGLGIFDEVVAVDQSAVGLERASSLASDRGVSIRTQQADLATYDLGTERYQLITSISAHVPPDIRSRLHAAVQSALAPGGYLILEAYTPAQVGRGTGGPPNPEWCMTLDSLSKELPKLERVVARETDREVVEGRYHTGVASVVQLVARR